MLDSCSSPVHWWKDSGDFGWKMMIMKSDELGERGSVWPSGASIAVEERYCFLVQSFKKELKHL